MKYQEDTELSELIKSRASYFEAPQKLHDKITAGLAGVTKTEVKNWGKRWLSWQQWSGMGVAFACGVLLSITVIKFFGSHGQQELIASQVINGHVRSLMVAHLSDVESSDQHTVKPWFTGKLDYSPPVTNLATDGYPLVGGRLDYMDERPVAALVYKHQLHAINVFVWPVRGQSSLSIASSNKNGFNAASWQGDGMQYWAVSDLNEADLKKFAELLRVRKQAQS